MLTGSETAAVQAAQQLPLPEAMEVLKAYLRDHLADQIRIKHLASLVALSSFYFVRMFKAHVGVPPHRYLTEVRIERACELLVDTPLSVTQICHRVGFTSLSHFINTFRRHRGMSPSAYRRTVVPAGRLRSAESGPLERTTSWGRAQDRATFGQDRAIRPGALIS